MGVFAGVWSRLVMQGRFHKRYGRFLRRDAPELFDEKLILLYLKRYIYDKRVVLCTDKIKVREYLAEKHTLPKDFFPVLFGVFRRAEDIALGKLPDEFVLKCNHDSGSTAIIIKDQMTAADWDAIRLRLNERLKSAYGFRSGEIHYQHIERCILAEEKLGFDDTSPADYKFFCMNGRVFGCLVCVDRAEHDKPGTVTKRIMVDRDFKKLDVLKEHLLDASYAQYRPDRYADMLALAERLSAEFPFVRVDMYSLGQRIVLGEMTFTPWGCINRYISMDGQRQMGEFLEI